MGDSERTKPKSAELPPVSSQKRPRQRQRDVEKRPLRSLGVADEGLLMMKWKRRRNTTRKRIKRQGNGGARNRKTRPDHQSQAKLLKSSRESARRREDNSWLWRLGEDKDYRGHDAFHGYGGTAFGGSQRLSGDTDGVLSMSCMTKDTRSSVSWIDQVSSEDEMDWKFGERERDRTGVFSPRPRLRTREPIAMTCTMQKQKRKTNPSCTMHHAERMRRVDGGCMTWNYTTG